MKEYDVVVIGAGDVGMGIVFKAVSAGLKVALVEKGKVGGTCVNVGCVPSKMLIFPADRIADIEESDKLGIHADIIRVDFDSIMSRMKRAVKYSREFLMREVRNSPNLDFYDMEGHFVRDYTLRVGNGEIKGRKIFIATGARPLIPAVEGIEEIEFLTNESVLELGKRPESLIIIGGGYIAAEYGHFFSALGTKVTILQRDKRLVPNEEPEISELLKKAFGRRMRVFTGTEALRIKTGRKEYGVTIKDGEAGREREIRAEKIMIAAGRKSNADLLGVGRTGVVTDGGNFIRVNEYLETGKKNIWAIGDAIGRQMFTHAGDKEAEIAWHNATQKKKIRMDFSAVPHAVFTRPQIASVGLTEEGARKEGYRILVGKAKYSDTVKGEAMVEKEGFAKAVVEKGAGRILGFHIIGPEASILIQEVVNTISNKGTLKSITNSMHIFPALSDLISEALNRLE